MELCCKPDVRLSSFYDAVATNREAFCDDLPHPSPGGVVMSVPTVVCDDDGVWDFGNTPSGLSFGREKHRMVLSNIQELVSRAGLQVPKSGLDGLRLAEYSFSGCLTLIELRQVLTNDLLKQSRNGRGCWRNEGVWLKRIRRCFVWLC